MNKTLRLILIYTLLFGILAAVVFCQFLLAHRSFIQLGDGYRQGFFWLAENKDSLEAFLSGGGITAWSWSKGLGMETLMITDPFTVIAALFPSRYLALGYTFALILELYCCGLAFLAFTKEVAMHDFQCLLGALCYAFCGWGIDSALMQFSFVLKLILFPILILAVDRIYKGKSPLLFIITVAYYAITGIYFAYMAAIGVIIYILFRYAYYHDAFKASSYFLSLGRFVVYGITGLVISAVTSIPYITALLHSSTESSADSFGLFYDVYDYLCFGKHLLSQTVTNEFAGGYSYLGLSAIVLMAVPVAFRHFSIKSTPAIMSLICGLFFVFPFFNSALNGFGYSSSRWYFIAVFFILWTGLEGLDSHGLTETKNVVLMLVSLFVMFIWTIVFEQTDVIATGGMDENLFIMLNIFSGIAAIFVIVVLGRNDKTIWRSICIIGVCVLATSGCWNIAFKGNIDDFLKFGEINKQLERSTQRVSTKIEDDGFYRVDQVNGLVNNRLMSKPANENLWWKSRSLYLYDSKIPADMIKLNGLVGNNYGFAERVYMVSNDNRMGLDFLTGVKYFLGNDTLGEHYTPDYFAGYGFKKSNAIDGVTVWENKYNTSLGFGYGVCISETEFNKLNRLQREQALMQAVVIPDDTISSMNSCREVKAKEIETKIYKPKFTIEKGNNIEISNGQIIATADDATFMIHPKDVPAGQLILSFDGFGRLHSDGSKGNSIKIYVSDSKIEKSNIWKYNNQALPYVDHFDINLGYYKSYEDTISVRLPYAGTYQFDDIYLSSMSAKLYDKYAVERMKNVYNISSFDNQKVTGTVNMQEDGILYFSIYDYDNWDVYVDGKKAELIDNVNIAFTGVELSHGQHEVVLKYSFRVMKIAATVSLAGLLAALIICLLHRRMRKRYILNNEAGQHQ